MEPVEQMGAPPIAKGKRTKRHRTHSPIPFTNIIINPVPSSSSSEQDSTTTEEEDTAKCLILLAQGHFNPNKSLYLDQQHHPHVSPKVIMYTCKTCNRAFTSFQALGGHRASHKKPKNDKRSSALVFNSDEEEDNFPLPSSLRNRVSSSSSLSLQLSSIPNTAFSSAVKSPSPRIHECSYCGAEFTSGQALGGHMRRHRAGPVSPSMRPTPAPVAVELKSPRNVLSLDLNLPAPEDENQRFGFAGAKQGIKEPEVGLSTTGTPKLVDCHY